MSSELLLQKLQELQPGNISVQVPSQNRVINFKPLNIRQQKEIIKSSFDKNIPGISFNTVLNNIIKENSLENVSFLVTDRPVISLLLRKNIYGDDITLKEDAENDSEEKIKTTITELIKNAPTTMEDNFKTKVITENNIEIQLTIPSLETDNKVNKEAQKVLSHLLEKNNAIKDLISELFVYELIKFVNYVEIKNVTKAMFVDLTVSQQLAVIETLPASINKQIMEYVEVIRGFEKKFQSFSKNNQEYTLSIDASFFSNE
jgi:hypothetical protein